MTSLADATLPRQAKLCKYLALEMPVMLSICSYFRKLSNPAEAEALPNLARPPCYSISTYVSRSGLVTGKLFRSYLTLSVQASTPLLGHKH